MMTPNEKAQYLVNMNKMIIMSQDTDCGNEILCTTISIRSALITVDEMIDLYLFDMSERLSNKHVKYWNKVKQEIKKYT